MLCCEVCLWPMRETLAFGYIWSVGRVSFAKLLLFGWWRIWELPLLMIEIQTDQVPSLWSVLTTQFIDNGENLECLRLYANVDCWLIYFIEKHCILHKVNTLRCTGRELSLHHAWIVELWTENAESIFSGCFCYICLNDLDFRKAIVLVTFKCQPEKWVSIKALPRSKWPVGDLW